MKSKSLFLGLFFFSFVSAQSKPYCDDLAKVSTKDFLESLGCYDVYVQTNNENIAVRSLFSSNEDRTAVIDLLKKINRDNSYEFRIKESDGFIEFVKVYYCEDNYFERGLFCVFLPDGVIDYISFTSSTGKM